MDIERVKVIYCLEMLQRALAQTWPMSVHTYKQDFEIRRLSDLCDKELERIGIPYLVSTESQGN